MTRQLKIIFLFLGIVLSSIIVGLRLETLAGNRVGWLLVFIGLAYCMGGSIYLAAANIRGALKVEPGDRSPWLIAPGFLVAFMASPLEYLYLPPFLPRGDGMQLVGLSLLGAGLRLRLWTRRCQVQPAAEVVTPFFDQTKGLFALYRPTCQNT